MNCFIEYLCVLSCWLLWFPDWADVIHENVQGEIQEVGELSYWRELQKEDRVASTIVSTTHRILHEIQGCRPVYCMFLQPDFCFGCSLITLSNPPTTHLPRFCCPPSSQGPQSELSDPNASSFDPMFQPGDYPSQQPTQTRDYGYNAEQTMQTGRPDDFNPPCK